MQLLKFLPILFFILGCQTLDSPKKKLKKEKLEQTKIPSYEDFLRSLDDRKFQQYMEMLEKKYDWFEIYPRQLHKLDNFS